MTNFDTLNKDYIKSIKTKDQCATNDYIAIEPTIQKWRLQYALDRINVPLSTSNEYKILTRLYPINAKAILPTHVWPDELNIKQEKISFSCRDEIANPIALTQLVLTTYAYFFCDRIGYTFSIHPEYEDKETLSLNTDFIRNILIPHTNVASPDYIVPIPSILYWRMTCTNTTTSMPIRRYESDAIHEVALKLGYRQLTRPIQNIKPTTWTFNDSIRMTTQAHYPYIKERFYKHFISLKRGIKQSMMILIRKENKRLGLPYEHLLP